MSEGGLTVDKLYGMVLREAESDSILEMDSNTYRRISEFVGSLRKQEFDGVENEIRDSLAKTASELADILLRSRLEKGSRSDTLDLSNLLDEERYILDAEEEKRDRAFLVSSAVSRGKTRLLEYVSEKHRTRMVTVRFLNDVDALTGSDYLAYGPFKEEDVATIPHDNARALVSRGNAVRVGWID